MWLIHIHGAPAANTLHWWAHCRYPTNTGKPITTGNSTDGRNMGAPVSIFKNKQKLQQCALNRSRHKSERPNATTKHGNRFRQERRENYWPRLSRNIFGCQTTVICSGRPMDMDWPHYFVLRCRNRNFVTKRTSSL
jgi:hypothetical protein